MWQQQQQTQQQWQQQHGYQQQNMNHQSQNAQHLHSGYLHFDVCQGIYCSKHHAIHLFRICNDIVNHVFSTVPINGTTYSNSIGLRCRYARELLFLREDCLLRTKK
jgi:hypothetical protein